MSTKPIPLNLVDPHRFWLKVSQGPKSKCWNYQEALCTHGYGQFRIRGNGKFRANRVAYALTSGDPGKLHVLHTCDNRACCNPNHLFLGTNNINQADKAKKGRSASGERNGRSKLTAKQVSQIRRSSKSNVILAKQYDVSSVLIGLIKRGKVWKL